MTYNFNTRDWMLIDSNFSKSTQYGDAAAAIMDVYPSEEVLPNLKAYYSSFYPHQRRKMLERDAWDIYPEFNFKKYYPCLRRHIDKLKFIGK
jgi:hypothetical protein